MKNHKLSKLLLASVISSLTVPTLGQQLEEVVVTASKRAENLQDIPQAVTAFSSERLVELGIVETSDLMGAIPNIQVTSAYGRTQPNFSIRGISVANEFSAATASPVGVYVDEVYQSFRASHGQQLFDLESVEVLRGPQGTLYGRNTTGGALNVITAKADTEGVSGGFSVNVGNYSAREVKAHVNLPINDELAVLDRLLLQAPDWLQPDGLLAIISFHSLEDRRVKTAFLSDERLQRVTRKPLRADEVEQQLNPRSRSAKLRIARRQQPEQSPSEPRSEA